MMTGKLTKILCFMGKMVNVSWRTLKCQWNGRKTTLFQTRQDSVLPHEYQYKILETEAATRPCRSAEIGPAFGVHSTVSWMLPSCFICFSQDLVRWLLITTLQIEIWDLGKFHAWDQNESSAHSVHCSQTPSPICVTIPMSSDPSGHAEHSLVL